MAKLKFAILQYLEGQVRIVLQRDEKQLLDRLDARVKEQLIGFADEQKEKIVKAIDKAFNDLIQEFKDETIRIV